MATGDRPEDAVRLATANNAFQAHIWQQALEKEGIEAFVMGDYLEAGLGDIPGLNAELWVPRNDLARAQEILRQGQEQVSREPDEEPE